MNIMKRPVSLLLLLCLTVFQNLKAQSDAHFNNFIEVENFYNPAAMNRNGRTNVVGALSMQMAGYTNAPVSMFIGANMPIPFGEQRNALGVGLFNETLGLFTNRRLLLDYSYKIGMGKGWMNIGVQAGVMSEEFNGGKLKMETQNDPAFPAGNERGTAGDLGAGILYVRGEFWAGASAQHLNFPHVEFGKTEGKNTEMDMGATYSPGISISAMIGGKVRDVLIGYAYEFYTSGVGALKGSHDLTVSWQTDVDLFKKGKNVHKSVRYL